MRKRQIGSREFYVTNINVLGIKIPFIGLYLIKCRDLKRSYIKPMMIPNVFHPTTTICGYAVKKRPVQYTYARVTGTTSSEKLNSS